MKRNAWLAWTVLVAAALAGGKWMLADDQTPIRVPLEQPQRPSVAIDDNDRTPLPAPGAPLAAFEDDDLNLASDPFAAPGADPIPRERADDRFEGGGDFTEFGSANEVKDLLNKHSAQNLTLEWVGPVQIKVGRPFIYELVVRNVGSATASDVVLRDTSPENMKITAVEPRGIPEGAGYMWSIGQLAPRQERRIKIEMIAEKRGEISCHATVTATTPANARFRISEPKLVLSQDCPEKVMLGDVVTVTVAISNPGDGPAENVTINSALSEGLKHEKGQEFSYELGTLAAGETRSIQLACSTVAGGEQSVHSVAVADGGALQAEAESYTLVTEPKIDVVISGPRRRYLERGANYKVVVTNPGDASVNNVKLRVMLPAGFKYIKSSTGGRHDYTTRTISWFVGTISGGETKEFGYRCTAVQTGDQKHLALVAGQRALKGQAEIVTGVEGISALLLEVVDVDDPIEVGADTAYEIRVTNQGSREATNVIIQSVVPREMSVRGGQGPTKYRSDGQEIVFSPLPKLAPKAVAIYRVYVTGSNVGDARFQARLLSDSLTEPVIEEESTKVYDDE